MDALSSPKKIVLGHLLNQVDCFGGQPGVTAVVAGFEFPEEPKALAMPAEQGVRPEDPQMIPPVFHATGKEDEPKAVGLSKGWFFDLAVKDNELLPKESVLGDKFGFAAREVDGGTDEDRIAARLGEMQEGMFKERNHTENQLGEHMN